MSYETVRSRSIFRDSKNGEFLENRKLRCAGIEIKAETRKRIFHLSDGLKNHENYSTGLIAEKYCSEDEQKTSESYSSERYGKLSSS